MDPNDDSGSALARNENRKLGLGILHDEKDSPFTQAKIRKLSEIISALDQRENLADVGCFDGRFFDSYSGCGVKSIDGFDILPEALELARKRKTSGLGRDFLWDFENEKAPVPDCTYDVIVCADVIEHIFNTRNLVSECYRILKPKGTCIFLTPNLVSLWNRYRALFGKMPLGHPGVSIDQKTEGQVNLGHSRMGTAKEWVGLLESAGFKVDHVDGLWRGRFSKIISLGRPTLSHTIIIECSRQED
jgi:2-polyprenyl-3-methyl-5-hydroxy-6-metoxy-1,4-benzoquinol methylase